MSNRAELAALKVYPPKRKEVSMTGAIYTVVGGDFERRIFKEGYELAEKDLALTWEDIRTIDELLTLVYEPDNEKDYYQRVLEEFNKKREYR